MPSSTVGLQIRTFRAKSMQAAMAMIRQELGPSAAILETRPITSSMTRWLTGNRIEVTASSAIDQPAATATMSAATSNLVASQAAEKQRASTSPATEAHRSSAMTSRHQERVTRTAANPAQVPSLGKQADRLESLAWEKWQQEREREERGRGRSKSAAGMELSRLLWEELQEVGFSAEWAERLLQATRDSLHHQAWENESLMRGKMAHWVQHQLSIAPAIPHEMGSDRPYVVALVGPTGVGKTTTLAKLAASLTLEERLRVGLITIDTYRVGAIEQLKKYADIMHLPMAVVETESQMRASLRQLASCQMIFIDTAGRTPRDSNQLAMMQQLMSVAKPDETHLVLSATTSVTSFQHALQRYAAIEPNRMVLSKLDEVRGMGELFPALCQSPLPISYVTTGQSVPEDIEPAIQTRLAAFLLGQCPEFPALEAMQSFA